MTHAILGLLLRLHIAIVPLFVPSIGGVRTAHETVSYAPHWHQIVLSGELQQPDGAMILYKGDFQ